MRRPKHARGRIYRRKSHRSGAALSTYTMVYVDADGKERRESTGETDYTEAQKKLTARQKEVDDGKCPDPDRGRVTVGELLTALLDSYAAKGRRSLPSARAQIGAVRTALGGGKALDLTTARVERTVTTWQRAGLTNATINRRLSYLRRAYSYGKIVRDPARLDFSDLLLDEASPLGKHLDPAAFAALHAALPASLADFFEFAYLCGTRKGQLARTTWAHWNPATKEFTWSADEVKVKRSTILPLDGRPLALIERLHAARRLFCPFVFHGALCAPGRVHSKAYGCVGHFETAWATACRTAGFPVGRRHGGFVFHNTRHTAVTNLVNAGVPTHEAMTVSGHRTRSVFDRYSLSLKQQTKAALRRVTEYTQQQNPTPTVIPVQRQVQRGDTAAVTAPAVPWPSAS